MIEIRKYVYLLSLSLGRERSDKKDGGVLVLPVLVWVLRVLLVDAEHVKLLG